MTIIASLCSLCLFVCFLCSMAKVSQIFLPCISTRYFPSIIYFPSRRFFKATPTQQTLPRRYCPSTRWHASSESVPLPGKQALRCALRCMDARSQVGDLHACWHAHLSLIFARRWSTLHTYDWCDRCCSVCCVFPSWSQLHKYYQVCEDGEFLFLG